MPRIIFCLLLVSLVCSCGNKQKQQVEVIAVEDYAINYAQGFRIVKAKDYTHITVRNPWDTTALLQSYILIDKNREIPPDLPTGQIIRTPITEAAISSSTQCSTLQELNSIAIVKGVCEPEYIKNSTIEEGIKNSTIVNLGMAQNPNTEAIILLNPEVFFSDPVTGQSQASIEKSKIPIIQTPDYTEPHPLGRAEWIRFYAQFVGKEALADSLFAITAQNYLSIKEKVNAVKNKPTVFTDIRYQGKWNMAGGKSFMASLYADAGADYLWSDNESTTFLPLSFEVVLDKAGDGDIWIIRYSADQDMTYNSLKEEYKPYSYFKAFKEKNIYGCNAKYASYFDDLPIHPDYVLQDLAYVFHPQLFPDYQPRYYKKLED